MNYCNETIFHGIQRKVSKEINKQSVDKSIIQVHIHMFAKQRERNDALLLERLESIHKRLPPEGMYTSVRQHVVITQLFHHHNTRSKRLMHPIRS